MAQSGWVGVVVVVVAPLLRLGEVVLVVHTVPVVQPACTLTPSHSHMMVLSPSFHSGNKSSGTPSGKIDFHPDLQ